MSRDLVNLKELDRTQLLLAGGKGANLGELMRIDGVRVPPGFVVTTEAFRRSGGHTMPADLAAEITGRIDEGSAYAVRSSATAEDLPGASFAGQHDTWLNLTGPAAILEHVKRCWASLFTERAVAYRRRSGFDERKVQMAVVVQQMVPSLVSGVLFTADPLSGNRKVSSVEAVPGLGEALVSGRSNPEAYQLRDGKVLARKGTALTDPQLSELERLGRRIEAHFGAPQDIEWCLSGDGFHVVQSRPITTLFPIPAAADGDKHVYLSVGHQQMMTDPLKPLGISFWQLTAARPMFEAGGRLFVDVTRELASPAGRARLLEMPAKSDPLVGDALRTIVERDFIPLAPGQPPAGPPPGASPPPPIANDPQIVAGLIARTQASLATLKAQIASKSGQELLDFIFADLQELKRLAFDPLSFKALMAGIEATWWINEKLLEWLGETNAADVLTQSVPNNVTSEMGLALLDVADAIRGAPVEERPAAARRAMQGWLEKYGMRCIGEIDITRPRWSEDPSALIPLILANVKTFEPGEAKRRFERGEKEAAKKEQELLARLRALPDGEKRAEETKQMIDRVRTFIGYREYPKYGMISRYSIYKQALVDEAKRRGLDPEDLFFLTFQELRANQIDLALIRERREALKTYQSLTPPRVLTSEGESLSGSYHRSGLPAGALAGLAVSAGTVEGRARVVLDIADAVFEPGDILVTRFTDPSWTPAFVQIQGLVTEIGGLMTHGAVIAREYGLPAVVGVARATELIPDGARIRVNGTDGSVERVGSR